MAFNHIFDFLSHYWYLIRAYRTKIFGNFILKFPSKKFHFRKIFLHQKLPEIFQSEIQWYSVFGKLFSEVLGREYKKDDATVKLLIYSKSLFNNLNFILIFNGFLNPLRKLSGHGPGVCRKLFPKSRILNKNWTYETRVMTQNDFRKFFLDKKKTFPKSENLKKGENFQRIILVTTRLLEKFSRIWQGLKTQR